MSGSVEDEVVRMRFDNNAFERGVSTTLSTLARLKNSLNFSGSGKGLEDVANQANKFNMGNVNKQIDGSAHHWSAWRTAGLIAFATVVHQAVRGAERVLAAFTVDPIKAGFESYQTQINAAKIIISNTGAKLPQVEAQLAQLQTYANQTVYSFSDMAKNIGTFTAAGVKLVPAVSAIKGMGNSAALSGASVEQLNSAMYQMSQAMSSGVIRLQDWNSLSNANMGGQNIQKALMATADTIKGTGPKMDAAIKKYGNFRNSLTAGWLTADVFSKTMGVMAGTVDKATGKTVAFSVAQLRAKGYTQAQAVQLNKLSQAAIESATQIRTWDQLTAALKEEVGTAWGTIFKTIFGNLNGATKLFTGLHTFLENVLTAPIYHLNNLLQGVDKLGGRKVLIDAFKLAFMALGNVIKPIKAAFREIFPATTAKEINDLIIRFHVFAENLNPLPKTVNEIKRTFAGFFAILDIGKQIVMGVFHVFTTLLGAIFHGSGGFLGVTANVGDMIVAFDKALKSGGLLSNIFKIIGNVLSIPVHLLSLFGHAVASLFSGFHTGDAKGMTNSVTNAGTALAKVANVTQRLSNWFAGLSAKLQPAIQWLVTAFGKVGHAIASVFSSAAFGNILQTLNAGLFAGIILLIKNFLKNGLSLDIGNGFLGKAGEAFDSLTSSLHAMTLQLKAKALLDIAISVGILAASMLALSFIDPKKLGNALKAMAVGFGELLGSMAILTKISGSAGFIKIPLMAASLDLLAGAILILSAAVVALSLLSWAQLIKGLTAVGVLLLAISIASYPLAANSSGMISAGIGITAIAVALNLLYFAVKNFAKLSWKDMEKGLGGIGIALGGLAIAMRLMPTGMLAQGAGILLIATALNALYLAVKLFSGLSWTEMIKGLVGVAGSLAAIAVGMALMPETLIAQAVALDLVAVALLLIGKAMANMSKLSWTAIAKGLVGVAGGLAVMATTLTLMDGSIQGAAAILVVAAALRIFVPVLQALGSMSWGTIGKGLGALAASFALIGLAGLVISPIVPEILALGVALGLVGLAMIAFGAGTVLLGTGLTAIASAGGAAIGILLTGLSGLIKLLPTLGTNLALALANFIIVIGKNAPAIIGAFVSLLNSLLQAVPKIMPSFIVAINSLITTILSILITNAPKLIAAGFQLIMDLLNGINTNLPKIIPVAANIIINFLNGIASHIGSIINAGVNLLVNFLVGITRNLGRVVATVSTLIATFLNAVARNIGRVISAGANVLISFLNGIARAIPRVAQAAGSVIVSFLRALGTQIPRIANAGIEMIISLINGMANAINSHVGELRSAGFRLAEAIINGMTGGLSGAVGRIASSAINMAKSALSSAASFLGIGGPSKEFMKIGAYSGDGLVIGIDSSSRKVMASVENMGSNAVTAMKKSISGLGDAIAASSLEYTPTITPVLDLEQFTKDAAQMSGLVTPPPVVASVSYAQAGNIVAARQATAGPETSVTQTPSVTPSVTYNQYNTSPKALSSTDIYRQTRNQLAQTKQAIGF